MDLNFGGCLVSCELILVWDGNVILHNYGTHTSQIFCLSCNWSAVNHKTGQSFLLSSSSRDREVKWNGSVRVYVYSYCEYLSGGYLKCSGALLPAPFEGLN